MKNPEQEIQVLQHRLHALTSEASRNDVLLSRSLEREMVILEASSIQDLISVLVDDLVKSYGLDSVSLFLCDQDHEIRHFLSHYGDQKFDSSNVFFVDSIEALPAQIRRSGQPWLGTYRKTEHQRLFGETTSVSSIALIPLLRHNRLTGCLNFGSTDANRYTRKHATDFLHRLGTIAAFSLENAINRARLIQAGLTDELTKWYNRRYLEDRLQGELASAQRGRESVVCLLLDIDHFKHINDNHGHLAGDAVLREITRRVAGVVRASDIAARFGGDEFAILMPRTSSNEAMNLAERIRQEVSANLVEVRDGVKLKFSLSIGISGVVPGREVKDLKKLGEQLLAQADTALYRAKSLGRNRVALGTSVSGAADCW